MPEALQALDDLPRDGSFARPFARTAGDEIQALFIEPGEVVAALETFARLGVWRAGVGIGPVDLPVPDDVRAASGEALVEARRAVDAARASSVSSTVRCAGAADSAARAQAALGLLDGVWRRRRAAGWEIAQLLDDGLTQREAADRLGVTPSAVSQRVKAAAVDEVVAGRELVEWLLAETVQNCVVGARS